MNRPSVLKFNTTFHWGWKAVTDTGELLPEHVKVDGYANGWILPKPGSYNLTISYNPQKWFTVGAGVTGVGWLLILIGTGILLVRKKTL